MRADTGADRSGDRSAAEFRHAGAKAKDAAAGAGGGEGDHGEDENFRRLFAAIDFDPSARAPPPPAPPPPPPNAEGGGDGAVGWGGWLAISVHLRAPEVSDLSTTVFCCRWCSIGSAVSCYYFFFVNGLDVAVGRPKWCRLWCAWPRRLDFGSRGQWRPSAYGQRPTCAREDPHNKAM